MLPPSPHFFFQGSQAVLRVSPEYPVKGEGGSTVIGEPGLPQHLLWATREPTFNTAALLLLIPQGPAGISAHALTRTLSILYPVAWVSALTHAFFSHYFCSLTWFPNSQKTFLKDKKRTNKKRVFGLDCLLCGFQGRGSPWPGLRCRW